MFDDELAQEEDSSSVLALKHFVIYKLCPLDECNSCDAGTTHGEYVVEVQDYLQATVEYEKQAFEYKCENCNDDDCAETCYQYDNLEANGYVDASEYIECQQVNNGDDDGDGGEDGGNALYVGPRCSSTNNEIKIGLFSDEDCSIPYEDQEIEDVLGAQLSYDILKSVQSNDGEKESLCLSCAEMEDENQNNANDNADADDVNEMCESNLRGFWKMRVDLRPRDWLCSNES